MKTKYLVSLGALILILAGVAFSQSGRFLSPTPQAGIVGVDALMGAPENYKGVIQLEGAVTAAIPEKKLLVLIDRKEWEQCGKDTCALYKLPVQWTGTMPKIHDEILVQGEIKESSGKLIFSASKLETLPPRRKESAQRRERSSE